MSPTPVTHDSFAAVLADHALVVVDFSADWCAPCRQLAPIYERVAAQHPEVMFATVDTDAEQELAEEWNIRSVPTLMAFVRGGRAFSHTGVPTARHLSEIVEQLATLVRAGA